MTAVTDWPLRRLRDGSTLVVSQDRKAVSRVERHGAGYRLSPLGLDHDPRYGDALVERGSDGTLSRVLPADADEWLLSAEWDTDEATEHPTYEAAVRAARGRSVP